MINLPINIKEKNILVCAIGGGFDIFGGLPIIYSLRSKRIVLSSYNLNRFDEPKYNYKKSGIDYFPFDYFPEHILLDSEGLPPLNISGKVGVVPLREYYGKLIKDNAIEHIITIDCGVDSLMKGDEEHPGTILEEYVNFAALKGFDIPKTHICIGFGTEIEEKISHYRVLENISEMIRKNGYLGSCSLLKGMECFRRYKEAYNKVNNYPHHKRSHIHPRIIASVEGCFGEMRNNEETLMKEKPVIFISPLMGIYWFFDGDVVMNNIHILGNISEDIFFSDSVYKLKILSKDRGNRSIPY
jgi:hypothetical protein